MGENQQVSSLITRMFNQRLPQPRYTCIWDAQLVLDYIKKHFRDNKILTDKQLTLNVIILLALTSASRVGGLFNLDMRFVTRTKNKYSFSLIKMTKSWRQVHKLLLVENCGYSDDKDLYVVTALVVTALYCILLNGVKKVTKPSSCLAPSDYKRRYSLQQFLDG